MYIEFQYFVWYTFHQFHVFVCMYLVLFLYNFM